MENYQELLKELYQKYDPEKIDQIDFYLEKYKGKEKQFYITQKAKYEQKKSVTDSKKILAEAMARIAKEKKEKKLDEPQKEVKTPKPKKTVIKEVPKTKTIQKKEEKKVVPPPPPKEKKPLTPPISKPVINKEAEKRKIERSIITVHPTPIEKEKKEKKKRGAFWYFIWVILLLVIVFLLIYFLGYRQNDTSPPVEDIKKEKIEKPTEAKQEKTTIIDSVALNKTETPATTQNEEPIQETTPSVSPDRLYANDIQKPLVFVSCFAVKKENKAQIYVAQLQGLNLEAHYYWIPDIDAQGNSYFKVVVGPFSNVKSAQNALTKVQEQVNLDAYILTIK